MDWFLCDSDLRHEKVNCYQSLRIIDNLRIDTLPKQALSNYLILY